MTESTDRVLASIDEAIDGYVSRDYEMGPDAMRWQPDGPPEAPSGEAPELAVAPSPSSNASPRCSPPTAYLAPVGALADGPGAWTELGHLTEDGFAYGTPSGVEPSEAARRVQEQIAAQVRVNVEAVRTVFGAIAESVRHVGKSFVKLVEANHPGIARLQYGDDYRRHRRACRLCNPGGNPIALRVNGTEYQRRTRARRRRNRR